MCIRDRSYNNTIPIFAENDVIKNQVMNIVTDSAGLNDPKDKDTPLFKIYSLFLNNESKKELADRYDTPGLKYMDIKRVFAIPFYKLLWLLSRCSLVSFRLIIFFRMHQYGLGLGFY